jgi:hypothetical protein
VKGCNMLAYARPSGLLSREGYLSCHICSDTGPRFFRSHPKDRPYDSQGDAEDLSLPGSLRVPHDGTLSRIYPLPSPQRQRTLGLTVSSITTWMTTLVIQFQYKKKRKKECQTNTLPVLMHQMRISTIYTRAKKVGNPKIIVKTVK